MKEHMIEHIQIKITRIDQTKTDIPLPAYATEGSAGMDLCAAVDADVVIQSNETVLVPTGFSIELLPGFEAQIRPRSGLAIKHRIGILNSPGTIDSDYRGEIKIILTNFGTAAFTIHRGDRIAQMVIVSYSRVLWNEQAQLAQSARGEGGFGHTGIALKEKD
jgi:dUTP pyrophosphatase